MKLKAKKTKAGQSLVELLIALGLSAILIPSIFGGFAAGRAGRPQQGQRLQALALAKEAQEATRSVREAGWSNVSVNGIFHPEVLASAWTLVPGAETITQFSRQVVIEDVFRDTEGQIVETDGTIDPLTKKITTQVSWPSLLPSTVSLTTYLSRYLEVSSYLETTEVQFNLGIHTNTIATNTLGGEVKLGGGGKANWCDPSFTSELNLPKFGKATSVTAVYGEAFAGTGENASGESLVDINIPNSDPPNPSIIETIDGVKTNDIFGESNYAYIATDLPNRQVVIFNIATTPFTEIGFYRADKNDFGESIFVLGNVGFLTQQKKLLAFDLTSKEGQRPTLGEVGLLGVGRAVYVVGTYAYVAIEGASGTAQLQIIDVADPANMQAVGTAKPNNQHGQDVFVNETGTRAYIVTNSASPEEKEFFIIDVTGKTGLQPVIGSYHTNGMSPEGVEAVSATRAIIVGQGQEEYQVINMADETSPIRCGGLQIDEGIFDSASLVEPDGDAYAYIVTGNVDSEFKIIEGGPGPGGGGQGNSGTFESAVFDALAEVAFHRIKVTFQEEAQTDFKLQVGIADPISGSCQGVSLNFVGPDGTSNTFFEAVSGKIPLDNDGLSYENPGQCFGYKAFFESQNPGVTPVLFDVTTLYSL